MSVKKEFSHTMTMGVGWRQDFIDQLGARLINPRQLIFPDHIAHGGSYFMEVMPGLMVLIVDLTFQTSVEFTKIGSKEAFCIAYYDLSDEISIHQVSGTKHKVGYHAKLGMALVDAALKSTYTPPVSERMYSFRLLISKQLLKKHLHGSIPFQMGEKAFDLKKNNIFFYSHIGSHTRLALLKLKDLSYDDPSFELSLKGTALQAFGYLIQRMHERGPAVLARLSEAETAQVLHTEDYLMGQLLEAFPGVDFLAAMAGMSISRYNKVFKKLFKASPNSFFLNEKLLLGQVLLKSGEFNTISEVAYELSYGKPSYFAKVYKKAFSRLPADDFLKKV
ncbi:MAG: AraC family transcriptional regulator [Bacteroidota bacterium]